MLNHYGVYAVMAVLQVFGAQVVDASPVTFQTAAGAQIDSLVVSPGQFTNSPLSEVTFGPQLLAEGTATAGSLGVFALANQTGALSRESHFSTAVAFAGLSATDVIFKGADGSIAPIDVSMNLEIKGSNFISLFTEPVPNGPTADGEIRDIWTVSADGSLCKGVDDVSQSSQSGTNSPAHEDLSVTNGLLVRDPLVPQLSHIRCDVIVRSNTPVPLLMQLLVSTSGDLTMPAFTAGAESADYIARADFSHTFSLPTDGPVFDLPAGYTASSVSLDIVNDQWLGGPESSKVPEPPTLLLTTLGLLGVVIRYRDCRSLHRSGRPAKRRA